MLLSKQNKLKINSPVTTTDHEYDESEYEEKKRVLYLNTACFLIEHGRADLSIRNEKYETALDLIVNSSENSYLIVFLTNFHRLAANSARYQTDVIMQPDTDRVLFNKQEIISEVCQENVNDEICFKIK